EADITDMGKSDPDFILDIRGSNGPAPAESMSANAKPDGSAAGERPWIGIHFECCGVYCRVYRAAEDTQYQGRCPKCARKITLKVGPEGVASRVFVARPT